MNRKSLFLTLAALGIALAAVVGCQVYDFEPVQPLAISQTTQDHVIQARGERPELMLLVDKSGSMDLPIDGGTPGCIVGGNECGHKGEPGYTPCDTSVCPTRWSELQKAMGSFIPDAGDLARLGLSVFPGGTSASLTPPGCNEPTDPLSSTDAQGVTVELSDSQDVPLELEAHAQVVANALAQIKSSNAPGATGTGGGTPAGPALHMLGNYQPLVTSTRTKLILLLTDGLPNCNPDNPNSFVTDPVACRCTAADAQCAFLADAGYPTLECNDQDNTVNAITALHGQGVSTIVIGFGAETAADSASGTLNAMATAGGFGRSCIDGSSCDTGEACDATSHLCARRFYQAANSDELLDALNRISALVATNLCIYELDAQPPSADFISVTFNGSHVDPAPDTWQLTPDNKVQFFGNYCTQLQNSNQDNVVTVVFRIVQQL